MKDTLIHPSQIQPTKDGYDNLEDQIEFGRFNSVMTGAAPALYQEFSSMEGQRSFRLSSGDFIVGDNSLMVFVNGQLMRKGADNDYLEVDNKEIEFLFGLEEGDVVVLRVNGGKSGPSLYEELMIKEKRNSVHLGTSYTVGNHSLTVYVNGAYQTVDIDYLEVDSVTVNFLEPLEEGDLVVFKVEGLPSEQVRYSDVSTVRIVDANGLVIREESTGDGYHVIQEYTYDKDGRPEQMMIKESGYTKIRIYKWVENECVGIEEKVVGVS